MNAGLQWGLALVLVELCACGSRTSLDLRKRHIADHESPPATMAAPRQSTSTSVSTDDGSPQGAESSAQASDVAGSSADTTSIPPPTVSALPRNPPHSSQRLSPDFWGSPRTDRLAMVDASAPQSPMDYAPPFDIIETPWRRSSGTLCIPGEPETLQLWADERGLATLSVEGDGFEVRHNTGHGWTWAAGYTGRPRLLSGYPGGNRLILGGWGFVVDLELDGTMGEGAAISSGYASDIAGLDAQRALVAVVRGARGSGLSSLFERRDDGWWDIPVRNGIGASAVMAANGDVVYVADRTVARLVGQYPVPVEGWTERSRSWIRELELMHDGTLYVFADDDVNSVVDVYDGVNWTEIGITGERVEKAWSDGRAAYFVTEHSLGRASELGVEILLDTTDAPAFTFRDVTGIAGEGVFFSASDEAAVGDACSPLLVFFFDGTTYRRL